MIVCDSVVCEVVIGVVVELVLRWKWLPAFLQLYLTPSCVTTAIPSLRSFFQSPGEIWNWQREVNLVGGKSF